MITTSGKLFANKGASFEVVQVKLYESGVMFFTDANGEMVSSNRADLKVADKLGSIPREIILENNDLLIIEADPLVDSWLSNGKKSVSTWENSPKAVILSMILVPLSMYFIFAILIPKAAVVFAPYVPDLIVDVSSDHTMTALDKFTLSPTEADQEKIDALKTEWYELISKMELEHTNYNIQFRKAAEEFGPNAFALPNGTIVFTDQLLELVDYDKDILTAIFMHEIGHVEHHHSMQLIAQTVVTSIAIDYIFGDVSGLLEFFASVSNTIATNQFSQDLEWESDNFALSQLDKMGKDPIDFARGMQKFSEIAPSSGTELEQMLSSHPLTTNRIQNALDYSGMSFEEFNELYGESFKSNDSGKAVKAGLGKTKSSEH